MLQKNSSRFSKAAPFTSAGRYGDRVLVLVNGYRLRKNLCRSDCALPSYPIKFDTPHTQISFRSFYSDNRNLIPLIAAFKNRQGGPAAQHVQFFGLVLLMLVSYTTQFPSLVNNESRILTDDTNLGEIRMKRLRRHGPGPPPALPDSCPPPEAVRPAVRHSQHA